ncbi:hypothetical protein [Deinococcus deserti]|uniref:Uncharacterized protein n=1 Tax=Deinococcus deserti (strain DSM 17065 / CIP 109153 / LMG 22923 / VCD115) TaxID=546414 RepID=X5H5I3_DEIDV|nr:hypothetical protein [Deinococcus deserti]AHX26520.1 hypothetical protein Deide_15148 [Deinococcus deserti VCD115]
MSGFSGGGFSFSRSSHGRGGFFAHSRSSGHRGGMVGGLLGHSHSSGRRGHYVQGGHYRQAKRRRSGGCLGAFLVTAGLAGAGVMGLVSLIA